MRAVDSPIPAHAQPDFTDAERQQGIFLPCVCRPDEDITVLRAEDGPGMPTTVVARERLGEDIVRLVLLPSLPFPFRPGQFVHVVGPTGIIRPYSLANEPDAPLELHVRRIATGALSPWLCDEVEVGHELHIRGPFGHCHYRRGTPEQPLLLAGFSTGIAPMLGIVRDAVEQGHTGPIDLFFATASSLGLYVRAELDALAQQHSDVRIHYSTLQGGDANRPVAEMILATIDDLPHRKIFLSGSPLGVLKLDERLRSSTEEPLDITSDPFYFGRG
jgi:ferredoxin-NADP reductase